LDSGLNPLLIWYEQRALHKFIFDTSHFYKTLFFWAQCRFGRLVCG